MFRLCPKCGNSNHISARACPCGFRLVGAAEHQPHNLQSERQETVPSESYRETAFAAAPGLPRRKTMRQPLAEPSEEAQKRAIREKLLAEESDAPKPAATPKIDLNKFLTLASFLIVIGAIFAIWGGFADTTESSEGRQGEKEKSASLADANPAPDARYNSANNLAGVNVVKGTVIDVVSGDTIRIADANNQEYEVRLEGVDAPEIEQDFGRESQKHLFTLVFGKNVQVVRQTTASDGSVVGRVIVNGANVNLEQLGSGSAWHDKTVPAEQSENERYADEESAARKGGLGLWAAANPLSPWEFRTRANRNQIEQATASGKVSNEAPKDLPNAAPQAKATVQETKIETESQTNSNEIAPADMKSSSDVSQPSSPKVLTPVPTGYERKTTLRSVTATARCKDGTLSYSATRSGSCSRHGGVGGWLGNSPAPPAKTDPPARSYIVGPRGGCHVLDGGKKVYVDRDLCGN